MIDLILACAVGAAFVGGFKCGNAFSSFGAMWAALKTKLP